METTLYNELRNEFFSLNSRKEQLIKEIEKLTSAKEEIEIVMDELDDILTDYGTHVYDDYIENKGE